MSSDQSSLDSRLGWYVKARYGLFIHYGLYTLLQRGEWVMNREQIAPEEYSKLAGQFRAENFNAEEIAQLAVDAGMKYVILSTMHHEGFRLYDTKLTDYNSVKSPCGRDLVRELVDACRAKGLKIGLYHSLNNWYDKPDSVEALEDKASYELFIEHTFARLKELVTLFNPIDIMWYDGWWPFNAEEWQSQKMNEMISAIQPQIIFNGRNGLPGDMGTPEGHVSAPTPWRPWEACITHNNSWGFHAGDEDWKSPRDIADMLIKCASQKGNLLFNVGPKPDGSLPTPTVKALREVGSWLKNVGEAIYDTDFFSYDLMEQNARPGSEFNHHGSFSAKGNSMYFFVRRWVAHELTLCGVCGKIKNVTLLNTGEKLSFTQNEGKVVITGLPAITPDPVCPVIKYEFEGAPGMYMTGGIRTPQVKHPHYDPCPSDIAH